jgi:hypothetical protein
MARKLTDRIAHAVTESLRERDRLEMRTANALLSAIDSKPRRRRRSAAKNRRPSRKHSG